MKLPKQNWLDPKVTNNLSFQGGNSSKWGSQLQGKFFTMRRNKNKRPNKLCMKCFTGEGPRTGRCHIYIYIHSYISIYSIPESFEICTNENCGSKLNYPKQQQQQHWLSQWKQNNKSVGKGIKVERTKRASWLLFHCNHQLFFIHQPTHQLHSNINNSSGEKEEDGFGDVFRLKDTCYLLYDVIEKEGNTSMILKAQHNKYKYKTFKS